jgi:hypothetical protein
MNMSNAISMLKGFAEITSGRQKEFYKWTLNRATPVEVKSYKEIPGLKEKVERALESFSPAPKECYRNAFLTSEAIEGVNYIEGYANSTIGLPISHAFNEYNGYYFDLTNEEVLNPIGNNLSGYVSVVELPINEARKAAVETGVWGEYIAYVYNKENEDEV